MDLQHDFLGANGSRMPVDTKGAAAVLGAANAILAKEVLASAIPVLVVNQFPASARIGNSFRNGAAVEGSAGAQLDGRLHNSAGIKVITKSCPSAFTNPELDAFLRAQGVREIYVLGVFAAGCVCATVRDAAQHGYKVNVIADVVASNARWKKKFALWVMKRAGATLLPSVPNVA
jgi:nicotinamidase-related amidase